MKKDHEEKNCAMTRMNPIPTGLLPQGSLSHKTEAVLFDIYGTLFISGSGDIGVAKKDSENAYKLNPLFQKFLIEKPVENVLKTFFSEIEKTHAILRSKGIDFPEIRVEEIWKTILGKANMKNVLDFSVEYEMCVNPVYPMPNAMKVIDYCHDKNIRMGIISNAQFYTPRLFNIFFNADLASLGFDRDLIFFSYQLGYAKPSSYLFQQAVLKLAPKKISPESVIYVGNDMLNDIYPAEKAGFQTALFAGDKRSFRLRKDDPRCKNLKPDLVITDLIQLLDHI
jgi:putative hydrolase of the HAD superfamily